MFNHIERYRRKRTKKATPITREQSQKLVKVLAEIGIPYTTFYNYDDASVDDKVICLLNDTFIVKDYFGDLNRPNNTN